MIQPAMQISIRRIFFSCILARKDHIAIAAIILPNGKIASTETRTDPTICSNTIVNHILFGFKNFCCDISLFFR